MTPSELEDLRLAIHGKTLRWRRYTLKHGYKYMMVICLWYEGGTVVSLKPLKQDPAESLKDLVRIGIGDPNTYYINTGDSSYCVATHGIETNAVLQLAKLSSGAMCCFEALIGHEKRAGNALCPY